MRHCERVEFKHQVLQSIFLLLYLARKLRVLDVSYNSLYRLPSSLDDLVSLEELNAAHNNLIYVPSELGKLRNLQEVDLNHNQILGLPAALFESCAISSLRSINLSANQITELPLSIGNLRNLKSLKLTGNQLKYLPVTIKQLLKLQTLYYGDNHWFAGSPLANSGKAYGVKALLVAHELSL